MATKLADLQVTKFATPITSATTAGLSNPDGLVVLGYWNSTKNGAIASTASVFAINCIIMDTEAAGVYVNTGTVASPTWTSLTIN
jgi:hypothetical protein